MSSAPGAPDLVTFARRLVKRNTVPADDRDSEC
jgi:hypothetical protein